MDQLAARTNEVMSALRPARPDSARFCTTRTTSSRRSADDTAANSVYCGGLSTQDVLGSDTGTVGMSPAASGSGLITEADENAAVAATDAHRSPPELSPEA
jgi:hypothetical protein